MVIPSTGNHFFKNCLQILYESKTFVFQIASWAQENCIKTFVTLKNEIEISTKFCFGCKMYIRFLQINISRLLLSMDITILIAINISATGTTNITLSWSLWQQQKCVANNTKQFCQKWELTIYFQVPNKFRSRRLIFLCPDSGNNHLRRRWRIRFRRLRIFYSSFFFPFRKYNLPMFDANQITLYKLLQLFPKLLQ